MVFYFRRPLLIEENMQAGLCLVVEACSLILVEIYVACIRGIVSLAGFLAASDVVVLKEEA